MPWSAQDIEQLLGRAFRPPQQKRVIMYQLVLAGKVLYLGVSDTPAWVVSKANTYDRLTGKTPFVVYQGAWSILQRDFERDIIPMARAEGTHLSYLPLLPTQELMPL